jgi:hypothetical protein
MFYVPKATLSVIVGSKYSCATSQARTTNMRQRTVASMSTRLRLPQPQCRQVSPDRALVQMRLWNQPRPLVIAGKHSEA